MLSARFLSLLTLSLVARASIVSDIVDAIEKAVDCASCHALVGVLQAPALLGDTIFSDALVEVCKTVKVSTRLQCLIHIWWRRSLAVSTGLVYA